MSLSRLVSFASSKENFKTLNDYVTFARRYLDFVAKKNNLQAVIVSQNEQHYRFFQYKKDGYFNITRPINSTLLMDAAQSERLSVEFPKAIRNASGLKNADDPKRELIRNAIYTIQQCIGATLDALPVGASNTARKINGDLFERLIRLLIVQLGVDCTSGNVNVPVFVDGIEQFRMSYQHDLIIKDGEVVKIIGGVKTSSKDRIDKIFIDKFLYSKLTDTSIPHVAIFLNDVQRKDGNKKIANRYAINSTFLPGRFKGYTIKLNPLDGVYYCDLRPNMVSDEVLHRHIRTIDYFFCNDLWLFVSQPGDRKADIEPIEN